MQMYNLIKVGMHQCFTLFLNPGDKLLGFDLSHGGHLTHGSSVTSPVKFTIIILWSRKESGLLNYENILRLQKKNPI